VQIAPNALIPRHENVFLPELASNSDPQNSERRQHSQRNVPRTPRRALLYVGVEPVEEIRDLGLGHRAAARRSLVTSGALTPLRPTRTGADAVFQGILVLRPTFVAPNLNRRGRRATRPSLSRSADTVTLRNPYLTNTDLLTPERAQAALEALGARYHVDDIRLERRDDRWFAFLPSDRLSVFPISAAAVGRVARERSVLRALERRCTFAAPRIVAEAPDGTCDLRAMVPGVHATDAVYARVRDEPDNAARVGTVLGNMIAEFHTQVRAVDISTPLPVMPEWPKSRAWIRERLPHVIDDPVLEAAAERLIAQFEDSEPAGSLADRVLVHTDLGLHNVSVDPDTLTVHGIFDWEAACWSDRHFDFRNLVVGTSHHPLFDAAVAVYEERTGFRVSRARVLLHNAALAVTYLAFRRGIASEERWCGRTLAEDLHWTRTAIAHVGARCYG
jgi:hypothetical protein